MMKEEKKLMCEGEPDPDIAKEAKAVLFFFVMAVCAILVCLLAAFLFYGVCELVKWLC